MFNSARLVFIDETSTNTAMVRLRGRCPRGIRLIDHVPHGHWKTIAKTLIPPACYDFWRSAITEDGHGSYVAFLNCRACLRPYPLGHEPKSNQISRPARRLHLRR